MNVLRRAATIASLTAATVSCSSSGDSSPETTQSTEPQVEILMDRTIAERYVGEATLNGLDAYMEQSGLDAENQDALAYSVLLGISIASDLDCDYDGDTLSTRIMDNIPYFVDELTAEDVLRDAALFYLEHPTSMFPNAESPSDYDVMFQGYCTAVDIVFGDEPALGEMQEPELEA